MPQELSLDIGRKNFNSSRPLQWLSEMRFQLNLATAETLAEPNPYCEALCRYAKVLKDHPAEMGPKATRPFLRFLELLDAKKESLFTLLDARLEYDEWLAQSDHTLNTLHNSPATVEMLASSMSDHHWNPLPFLARCEEHRELLEKHTPSHAFTAPLLAAAYQAIARHGYKPLVDSLLLHGIWQLCIIDDAPASTGNEEQVVRDIKLFSHLFPTSINAAMEHFYEQNDGNITPEMQDDIARMDFSHASGESLELLLRAMVEWQQEDNSAWAIVQDKHPLFAQSVDLHLSFGYTTNNVEGRDMLKSLWQNFWDNPQPAATIALPDLEMDGHGG